MTVGLLSLATAPVAASPFNLTATYTPAALAAPQSFRDGVQAAVDILKATIRNAITVTIEVDYGQWLGSPIGAGSGIGQPLTGSNSFQSYPTIRAALSNVVTSADDISFVAALPNTSSIQSNSNFVICAPVMKAIGLNPGTVGFDGKIGIGTGVSTANLVGVALHELTHALGRFNGEPTFDFGRFTSSGTRLFTGGGTSAAAYFSVDGGVTKLADFGVANDPADFLNSGVQGPDDAFNEFYSGTTGQTLTSVDKKLLDTLGYAVA